MVQSVLAGPDIDSGASTSQKNIITDIHEFLFFEKFIDYFREIFTGESLIDAYREIHTLLLSEYISSSHDIVGEKFYPILGLVKMLDITPENKRGHFKVSISPQSDEYFNIRVHYRDIPLMDGVITSNELVFLEKNLFNKNNGEITYPSGIDNNATFESVFLSAYKEYAKKNIEQEIQEIMVNVNDIVMYSASRDYDETDRNRKVPQHRFSYIKSHVNVTDIGRENNLLDSKCMLHILKHNTGNCVEMNALSAMLMVAILEKRIHTLNLNANAYNNISVSMLGSPLKGMDGYDAGCSHGVAHLCFNFYGVELKYIVDPWARRFFEYESRDDIVNNYRDIIMGNSAYLNENMQLIYSPEDTSVVNHGDNIKRLKKHMYEIHNVNLDDINPFKQERDRREAALANRFPYGSRR